MVKSIFNLVAAIIEIHLLPVNDALRSHVWAIARVLNALPLPIAIPWSKRLAFVVLYSPLAHYYSAYA